jgi:hypothetical protein
VETTEAVPRPPPERERSRPVSSGCEQWAAAVASNETKLSHGSRLRNFGGQAGSASLPAVAGGCSNRDLISDNH